LVKRGIDGVYHAVSKKALFLTTAFHLVALAVFAQWVS
jgi:hypothetical protein